MVVVSDVLKLIIGLSLAMLLNQAVRGRGLMRAVIMLPWAMPGFVAFLVWKLLYMPIGGAFNLILTKTNIYPEIIDYLGQKSTALPAVILATTWRGFPFWAIAFLAALQGVPNELYEAAKCDGASAWQRFWDITLPSIKPVILIVTLMSSIWTANSFENIWIMTQGGPSDVDDGVPGACLLRNANAAPRRSGSRLGGDDPRPADPGLLRDVADRGGRLMAVSTTTKSPPAIRSAGAFSTDRRRTTTRKLLSLFAVYGMMLLVAAVVIFPIYWMFTISLKLPKEIYRLPALIPQNPTLDNYRELIDERGFLTNIRNSLIIASSVTVVSLLISSFAAYSIVRFRYRFRGFVGRLILLTYLTPGSLLFIPLSIIVAKLGIGNSLYGLVILYLTFSIPLSTWLLSGYFRSVPPDLEEQAMVDGTTQLGRVVPDPVAALASGSGGGRHLHLHGCLE